MEKYFKEKLKICDGNIAAGILCITAEISDSRSNVSTCGSRLMGSWRSLHGTENIWPGSVQITGIEISL